VCLLSRVGRICGQLTTDAQNGCGLRRVGRTVLHKAVRQKYNAIGNGLVAPTHALGRKLTVVASSLIKNVHFEMALILLQLA
jgi:hypothetical protein